MSRYLLALSLSMTLDAWACDTKLDLDGVLDGYVQARGGHAAIESQQALRLISINHEGKWNPTFDYRVMKPGYMWIAAIYDDGAVILEGFDGQRGWEQWSGKPAEYVSGDAHKGVNQGAVSPVHLYGLQQMEALGAEVSLRGCASVEEVDYYVVRVVSVFGTDIDYYINAISFRLQRSRTTRPLHPTLDPTAIRIEERWADFRWVDGVLHPFRLSLWNVDSGERLSWLETLSIARFNADPALFAKPE